MKAKRKFAFWGVIIGLLLATLACQAVGLGRDKPDLEATIQAGMEATRQAEASSTLAKTPTETFTTTAAKTELPSTTPSTIPSSTPSVTPSITPSITPSPDPVRELALNHLRGLGLFFDANIWTSGEDDIGRVVLESQAIPGCKLQEQGPTEPPPINYQVQIGTISYDLAEFEATTDQGTLFVRWYLARDGFENPNPSTIPVLILISALEDADICLASAQDILETLHPVNP